MYYFYKQKKDAQCASFLEKQSKSQISIIFYHYHRTMDPFRQHHRHRIVSAFH